MKKAMIVAAHPDDAELAIGATIAKLIDQKWNIMIVDLTDGEPTPFGSKQTRKKETQKANNILGVKNRICLEMKNRHLMPTIENRKKLAQAIRDFQPQIIFAQYQQDYHPDHTAAAKLVIDARFEAKLSKSPLNGKPWWTEKLFYYFSTHKPAFVKPDLLIDVSAHWPKKIAAIKAYQSQLKNNPYKRTGGLLQQVESTGRYWGNAASVKYAEPFITTDPILIKKFDLLLDSKSAKHR